MKVAVLVKQVPRAEDLRLLANGRLDRHGVELEMNAYCRRAVSKGVELAKAHGGRCVVFTLGPPSAEDVLREAVAWGAGAGVLISDRAFAGSDTLATARALAAALRASGPWDLVLVGRNSIDADTGQVGPQMAHLLDLPFAGGVRRLTIRGRVADCTCELDDGWRDCDVLLPAVLSTAERLTEPCKVPEPERGAVLRDQIRRMTAADLGPGPWGTEGSATRVGAVRSTEVHRRGIVLAGGLPGQVARAVQLLRSWGALQDSRYRAGSGQVTAEPGEVTVPSSARASGPEILVVVEPGRSRLTRELLGEAAHLAHEVDGVVSAIGPGPLDAALLSSWGADAVIELVGSTVEEDVARALSAWSEARPPWAALAPGTLWGREVAARTAARLQAGLTGDAVGLGIEGGRLVSWKPAFGGRLVAAITATSELQMVTVRPGVLSLRSARPRRERVAVTRVPVVARGRVRVRSETRDDEVESLLRASTVVSVGAGVSPDDYPMLQPLLETLGAELAASRKVTDKGWLPRARQVGITGQSIDPALLLTIGISGKPNHMIGTRGAGTILAINCDAGAPVFGWSDVGIVGDWREVVKLLRDEVAKD